VGGSAARKRAPRQRSPAGRRPPLRGMFTPMRLEGPQYQGMYQNDHSQLSTMLEDTNLVKSESMDITNDPRFFTDNVIDKRLAAFAGLSVVSGLMVQNAISQSFGMKKNMDFTSIDGIFQFIGFVLLSLVLYANMLATYVGVAQPYHTYRLMTAGPTGFETAAAYYLHKDIVAWRHFSVKLMLLSMPVFIISSGCRFIPKFDRDATKSPTFNGNVPPVYARLEGLCCLIVYCCVGLGLLHIHWRHEEVFRRMYDFMYHGQGMGTLLTQVQQMMVPRMRSGGPPVDV